MGNTGSQVTQRVTLDREGPFGDEEGRDYFVQNPAIALGETDKYGQYRSPFVDKGTRTGKQDTVFYDSAEVGTQEDRIKAFEEFRFGSDMEAFDKLFMGEDMGMDERAKYDAGLPWSFLSDDPAARIPDADAGAGDGPPAGAAQAVHSAVSPTLRRGRARGSVPRRAQLAPRATRVLRVLA